MANIIDLNAIIAHYEKVLKVCNKEIENLTQIGGFCLCKCNSIVINKERMMTVTTDETHHTTYEFSPLYPTYFSPEVAREIVENDIYKDIHGNRIEMTIIGELEYYKLLKAYTEKNIKVLNEVVS